MSCGGSDEAVSRVEAVSRLEAVMSFGGSDVVWRHGQSRSEMRFGGEAALHSSSALTAVLAVKERRVRRADEELAPVGVGAGVGHGEGADAAVSEVEILVVELAAVCRSDGSPTRAPSAQAARQR